MGVFNFFGSLFGDKIVEKNFHLMVNTKRGGMQAIMVTESMGGNAGDYDGFPCVGANFLFDNKTGEIYEFGNYLRQKSGGESIVTFRIALMWDKKERFKNGYYKIIDIYGLKKTSRRARTVLNRSIALYNGYWEGRRREGERKG